MGRLEVRAVARRRLPPPGRGAGGSRQAAIAGPGAGAAGISRRRHARRDRGIAQGGTARPAPRRGRRARLACRPRCGKLTPAVDDRPRRGGRGRPRRGASAGRARRSRQPRGSDSAVPRRRARSPPGTSTSGPTAPACRRAQERPRAAPRSTQRSARSATGRRAKAASLTGWSATTRPARPRSVRATRPGAPAATTFRSRLATTGPTPRRSSTTSAARCRRTSPAPSPPDEVYGLVAWHHRSGCGHERRDAACRRDAGPPRLRPAGAVAPDRAPGPHVDAARSPFQRLQRRRPGDGISRGGSMVGGVQSR